MKTGVRLGLYGVGLVAAFGGAFGVASAAVPDSVVSAWAEGSDTNSHGEGHGSAEQPAAEAAPAAPGSQKTAPDSLKGLSLGSDGYALSPVAAPAAVGAPGEMSFKIQDFSGKPLTGFTTAHEKDLHMIVVRSDGSRYRHVHPVLDASTGTWSIPWEWAEGGTYRVYADFTPAGEDASGLTLTRTVEVAGDYSPVHAEPKQVDEVDGFTVTLDGELVAGSSSGLKLTVTRAGEPVTTLQPYLGAFGHLVALREGDLAYLHVHAEGEEPQPGDTAGPEIAFAAEAPTAGRHLLYLDFQIDGKVHTAEFVLDAKHEDDTATNDDSHSGGH